jgi:hypothetical protein
MGMLFEPVPEPALALAEPGCNFLQDVEARGGGGTIGRNSFEDCGSDARAGANGREGASPLRSLSALRLSAVGDRSLFRCSLLVALGNFGHRTKKSEGDVMT